MTVPCWSRWCSVLGTEPRILWMLAQHSTSELSPYSFFLAFLLSAYHWYRPGRCCWEEKRQAWARPPLGWFSCSQGCHKKTSQMRWRDNRHFCFHSLGGRSQRSRCWHIHVSLEDSLFGLQTASAVSLHGLAVCVCVEGIREGERLACYLWMMSGESIRSLGTRAIMLIDDGNQTWVLCKNKHF